jgi:hypothetical protein
MTSLEASMRQRTTPHRPQIFKTATTSQTPTSPPSPCPGTKNAVCTRVQSKAAAIRHVPIFTKHRRTPFLLKSSRRFPSTKRRCAAFAMVHLEGRKGERGVFGNVHRIVRASRLRHGNGFCGARIMLRTYKLFAKIAILAIFRIHQRL